VAAEISHGSFSGETRDANQPIVPARNISTERHRDNSASLGLAREWRAIRVRYTERRRGFESTLLFTDYVRLARIKRRVFVNLGYLQIGLKRWLFDAWDWTDSLLN